MLPTTVEIIRSGLRADPTLSTHERQRLLTLIREPAAVSQTPPQQPRLIQRSEAAHRFGRSLRYVDQLAKQGILLKRRLPNRQRAAGFLESDVNALIAGQSVESAAPAQ